MLVRYQAEDKPSTVRPTATRGVSALLQGTKSVLMPENNERMARRALHVLNNRDDEENNCAHGHGEELLPLGVNGFE
jgi:lysine 2,3-aminomutase